MSKKLLVLILVPAVFLIAGYFFLQIYLRKGSEQKENFQQQTFTSTSTLAGKKVSAADLRPLFIDRMKQLLKKSSNGLYSLSVGDLAVDVLASKVSFSNVNVQPDKNVRSRLAASALLPQNVFSISLQSLVIEGVNLDDAITSKTMDYKLVRLVKPVIHLERQTGNEKKAEGSFAQQFLKEMKKLSIDKLVVEGGSVMVHDRQKGGTKKLSNVQVWMNDILLDSTTRNDKERFLFARAARIDFSNYSAKTKDGLYAIKLGNASVNTLQKKMVLKNVSFGSTLSKGAFTKQAAVAKEMYGLSLPSITIRGIDWWSALNEEKIIASAVETKGGKFSVYFDRSLPPKSKRGNFPSQMLMKLPLQLNIEKLRLRDLDVSYEEYNPLSQQSGTIYFDNASIDIANVNNSKKASAPMTINGTALFMRQVPLKAGFRFDMNKHQSGDFKATVSTEKAFEGSLLNSFAMPMGMMKVEKGTIQKLHANIKGDESGASGNVLLLYQDLKLSLLEKDQDKRALDKKDVTSLFANLIVLKEDNPKKGKEPRSEAAEFKHDPTGGFMMLVWKTVLVGVLKTVGAPEKMASKKKK